MQANQKDLEIATERLSEYLERDVTTDELSNIKQKVQDKAKYEIKLNFIIDVVSVKWVLHILCTFNDISYIIFAQVLRKQV